MMAQAAGEMSIIAFTTGTAVLAVLHWLNDIRQGPKRPAPQCECRAAVLASPVHVRQPCWPMQQSALVLCVTQPLLRVQAL